MLRSLLSFFRKEPSKKLIEGCGTPTYPSLLHSALNPYRPIVRISGDQQNIVAAFASSGIPLGREMQGDRFGQVTVNGTAVTFGLICTHRDKPEMFIEIAKCEESDRVNERERLQALFHELKARTNLQMELIEL